MTKSAVRSRVVRRVCAVVVTAAIAFHWIPSYWWHHTRDWFADLPRGWAYPVSLLLLGVLLTVWSPAAFGLTWGSTWTRRWFIAIVGGGMTLVAAIGMLFIRVPFYGGTMAIYFVIPFEEELLFRGFLFAVLDDAFPRSWSVARLRFRTATLVTAVAFGLWHLGGLGWPEDPFILFQVFYTAIAGFLFALMRERTGSLWAPWLTHTVVNAWAVHVPGFWK